METMQGLHRTHGCGTISEQEVGKEVVLCGWVERRRDHGGLIFLDLRDRSGVVQVVASPDHNVESFHKAEDVRNEYVLCVRGTITKRDDSAINPNLPTGAYEMFCEELRVLNSAKTPPFYIQDDIDVDENIRLKYRYDVEHYLAGRFSPPIRIARYRGTDCRVYRSRFGKGDSGG